MQEQSIQTTKEQHRQGTHTQESLVNMIHHKKQNLDEPRQSGNIDKARVTTWPLTGNSSTKFAPIKKTGKRRI